MMPFEFTRPWLLTLLLVAAPVLIAFFVRSLSDFPRRQRIVSLVTRSLIVLLVILALAGFTLLRPTDEQFVMILADQSLSVGDDGAKRVNEYLDAALRNTGANRVAYLPFGVAPGIVQNERIIYGESPSLMGEQDKSPGAAKAPSTEKSPLRDGTNLAAAMEAAAAAGVDITAALERMGGKPDLYRRMLRAFTEDLPRIPGQASSALGAGDVKTATRVMHSLKGLAATLGADALASVASRSEARLAANPEPCEREEAMRPACDAALSALPALRALMHALAPVQAAAEPRPVTTAGADPAAALRALREISVQLRDADMAATDAVVRLRERFGDVLGAPLERLDAAVGALDFDAASRLCEDLMARLGSAPAPGDDPARLAEVEPA